MSDVAKNLDWWQKSLLLETLIHLIEWMHNWDYYTIDRSITKINKYSISKSTQNVWTICDQILITMLNTTNPSNCIDWRELFVHKPANFQMNIPDLNPLGSITSDPKLQHQVKLETFNNFYYYWNFTSPILYANEQISGLRPSQIL